jgi:uncharacterized protein (DUF305 family)
MFDACAEGVLFSANTISTRRLWETDVPTRWSVEMKSLKLILSAAVIISVITANGITQASAQERPPSPSAKPMPQHHGDDMSEGSRRLHEIMTAGQNKPMPMTGDVDKDFATMMTMHHQQAIQMSDAVLRHGSQPELKALAKKMQAAQREEIKKMAPYVALPAR